MRPDETTPLKAEGGKQDLRTIVIAGVGFLADAYDLFVIDLVIAILHRLVPFAATWKSAIASATVAGAFTGQLLFGVLGDLFGRRGTWVATCVLIIVGALGSSLCVWSDTINIGFQIAMCRFILGVGIGGEYPLSASIASENSEGGSMSRGRMISLVFSMQGWGMLLSPVFVMLFLTAGASLEVTWRAVLAIGAIPSACVIYARSNMHETEMYEAQRAKNAPTLAGLWATMKANWHPLVGTTMTWLLLDITFYGMGTFKHKVGASLVPHEDTMDDREVVWRESKFALYVALLALPGYILSVLFMDSIGRKRLQLGGFIAMAACFFGTAYADAEVGPGILTLLFGLTFLFSNFGPNTTTFVIPAEIYPTASRATCHGVSAAAGKLGAVIGTAALPYLNESHGMSWLLSACGVIAIVGAAFTVVFTSDEVKDLKAIDQDANDRGVA